MDSQKVEETQFQIVTMHADGTASSRSWPLDEGKLPRLLEILGPPDYEVFIGAEHLAAGNRASEDGVVGFSPDPECGIPYDRGT